MKKLHLLLFSLMLSGAGLILALLISINHTMSHLPLEGNHTLFLEAEALNGRLTVLDTASVPDGSGKYTQTYPLSFDQANGLSLYLINGEGALMTINGEAVSSASDSFPLSLSSFAPEESDFVITVAFTRNGETSYTTPILTVSDSSTVFSVHNFGTYQRVFIIAFSIAILVFCLCLFLQKRSERYLLWLALLVYTTASRTALNAFPAWKQIPVLNELLFGTIHWPFLSPSTCSNLTMVFLDALISYIHYRLFREFIPVTVRSHAYYLYPLPVFLLSFFCSGFSDLCYYLLIAGLTFAFLLEAYVIARAFPKHFRHCLILALAWIFTFSTRYFIVGNRLHLIADGVVNLQWRFRGLVETFYALAFVIIISGKFARKFSEAEEMAGQLEQQVAQKTAELKDSLHQLETVQRQKDEFTANIVHSIKTPIFTLGGYADMIETEMTAAPDRARIHLAKLNETADYANLLVNNLLLVMRLEEHHIEFHPTEADAGRLLQEVASASAVMAEKNGIRLLCSLPEKVLSASFDTFYMRQALQNIADNAVLHCKEGDSVCLSASISGAWILFSIEDTGCGIAPEELPHIFERYYSGTALPGSGASRHTSSGIGLTIAKEVVEQHGGSIQVSSEPGKGSLFTVRLPRADADPAKA